MEKTENLDVFLNIFLLNLWTFDTNFGVLGINYKLFLAFFCVVVVEESYLGIL